MTHEHTHTEAAEKHIDPVCGMTVDPATNKGGSHEHAGKTFYLQRGLPDQVRRRPGSLADESAEGDGPGEGPTSHAHREGFGRAGVDLPDAPGGRSSWPW